MRCSKAIVPTDGSRADGTVKLSYEYGMFEAPKLDEQQGLTVAQQRCSAWKYKGAEPFGGSTQSCISSSSSGCNRWLVSVEYQCTGNPPAPKLTGSGVIGCKPVTLFLETLL